MNKRKLLVIIAIVAIITIFGVATCYASGAATPTPTPTPTQSEDNGLLNDISNGLDNLFGGIGNVANTVINLPQELLKYLVEGFASTTVLQLVAFMTGFLDIISNMMSKGDVVFSSTVVGGIALLLRPFAYDIMCLLFMAGITKKAAYMEAMSMYVFFESLGLMLVSKFMVDNSVKLLGYISEINTSATNIVLNYPQTALNSLWDVKNIVETVEKTVSNPFDLIGVNIIVGLSMIILSICMIIIFVVLVSRQIELGVLAIVSPLFMATVTSSISNDVFKAFLKHFIGVVFQTLFMAVAIVIFTSSVFAYIQGTGTGIFGGFIEMLIGLVGLSFYIVRMPNSIKHMLGMSGGGGSGLSVASFAALLL